MNRTLPEPAMGRSQDGDDAACCEHLPEATPERVKQARADAGLTQARAAKVVHLSHAIRWSDYERGVRNMPLATWELFLLKTGQRELVLEE